MVKKTMSIICISFLMSACGIDTQTEKDLVFCGPYSSIEVWLNENEIDIDILHSFPRSGYVNIEYDSQTKQLWAVSSEQDWRNFYFYNITNGELKLDSQIHLITDKECTFYTINNNNCLFETDKFETGKLEYTIINLLDNKKDIFQFDQIDGKLPMEYPVASLGIYKDRILFNNGYFNMTDKQYYYYNRKLLYSRYIPQNNCILGLDENNYITIYSLDSNNYNTLPLKRKLLKYAKYSGQDLYYLHDNYLYFSKDINGIGQVFSKFFLIWYTQRNWYKYDLQTHKQNEIKTPSKQDIILGKL